jgi:hypothetical protein
MAYSKYETTNNLAADLVAECVAHYRHFHKPLKQITLKPDYYDMFKLWVYRNAKDDFREDQTYQFDGVDIVKGSRLMVGTPLYVDFYPMAQA